MQSKPNAFLIIGLVILVFIVAVLFTIRPGPEGRYRDDAIATVGISYFEFKDGKVRLVMPHDIKLSDGCDVRNLGTYSKQGNEWIYVGEDGYKFKLRTSLLSIEIIDSSGPTNKFPRLFYHP